VATLDDATLDALVGTQRAETLREEIELISMAGTEFDIDAVLRGELTPVCFGSAITNFGVELFLNSFVNLAPPPGPQDTSDTTVSPDGEKFSGFVFKIQANMDPRHRDRVAFLRVCSGRYSRDMEVWHERKKKKVRLAPPLRLFGQEREVIEEAFAGDVIGVINPGMFAIGDTVSERDIGAFPPLPRFQPEHFALIRASRSDKYKQFLKGLTQIEEEGAIQLFYPVDSGRREPILAAVGALQFDVVRFRLESEYGVETILEPLGYSAVRWVAGEDREIASLASSRGRLRAEDREAQPVLLFTTAWDLRYAEENAPALTFSSTPIS
jgi:peptide chain release factor 3